MIPLTDRFQGVLVRFSLWLIVLSAGFLFGMNSTDILRQGSEQYSGQKYEEAKELFYQITEGDPVYWHAQYYLGLIAVKQKEYEKASRIMQAVATQNSVGELKVSAHYHVATLELYRSPVNRQRAIASYSYVRDNASVDSVRQEAAQLIDRLLQKGAPSPATPTGSPFSGAIQVKLIEYNDNVANTPPSINLTTNKGGFVFGGSLNVGYRWWTAPSFNAKVEYDLIVRHHPSSKFANNDQWDHVVSVPLTWFSQSESLTPLKWMIRPIFTDTFANADRISRFHPKKSVLRTYQIAHQLTYLTNNHQLWSFQWRPRYEDSGINNAFFVDNPTGFGSLLSVSWMRFIRGEKKHGYGVELVLDGLFAKGDNFKHLNPGLELAYFFPTFWDIQGSVGVVGAGDFFYRHTLDRKDFLLTEKVKLQKFFGSGFSVQQDIFFVKNFSNSEQFRYKRFLTSTSLKYQF